MKRRRLLKALAAAPAAPVLLAQQSAPSTQPAPPVNPAIPLAPNPQTPGPAAEAITITTATADEAAQTITHFFTAPQLAALRKLSDVIMPPMNKAPGALAAGAPEFLDFLLSESPKDRQQLYRTGLDLLNGQAQKQFRKPFADLDAAQAGTLLAPLRQQWTYDPPADPLARFLRAAKADIRTATVNSREYSASSPASRRFGGAGLYWYPLD